MIRAVIILSAVIAVWRRLFDFGLQPAAIRRAILIPLVTVACAGCSSSQATRPLSVSDVSCVRSIEASGGNFLKAVAHCQKDPFNTLYPTMLDLTGAQDLQKQAFESGYYNLDLPASNAAETARLQSLQSGLAAAVVVRQKQQGEIVKPLSGTGCMTYLLGVPHQAFALGPRWDVGGQSPTNPYLTPQENYCVAQQRAATSPPGSLPDGATATYSAKIQQRRLEPPPPSTAPLAEGSAKSAHPPKGAHTANPPAEMMNRVFIL